MLVEPVSVPVQGAESVFCRSRPVRKATENKGKEELEHMLAAGVIRPGDGNNRTPLLAVPKKGTDRVRVVQRLSPVEQAHHLPPLVAPKHRG